MRVPISVRILSGPRDPDRIASSDPKAGYPIDQPSTKCVLEVRQTLPMGGRSLVDPARPQRVCALGGFFVERTSDLHYRHPMDNLSQRVIRRRTLVIRQSIVG
jgi:hypothetical protein